MKIQKLKLENITKFLKECKAFIFVTNNGLYPAARPFGAVINDGKDLYLPTNKNKNVYHQITKDKHAQILALKHGTREWIRISGLVTSNNNLQLKKKMWKAFPILSKRYKSVDDADFKLLKFKISKFENFND